jgi:hypothetical protein
MRPPKRVERSGIFQQMREIDALEGEKRYKCLVRNADLGLSADIRPQGKLKTRGWRWNDEDG